MGLILPVGLVVKNGIMLLDFSEKLHAEGEPFERAIAHADGFVCVRFCRRCSPFLGCTPRSNRCRRQLERPGTVPTRANPDAQDQKR
jgi:hypothetical protein